MPDDDPCGGRDGERRSRRAAIHRLPAARLNRIEDPRDPCRRHAVPRGDAVRFAPGSRDEAVGQPHRKEAEQALRPAVPEDAALKRSEHAQPHDPAERDADIEARILVLLNHHRHAALALQFVCQAPDGRREIGRDILHDGEDGPRDPRNVTRGLLDREGVRIRHAPSNRAVDSRRRQDADRADGRRMLETPGRRDARGHVEADGPHAGVPQGIDVPENPAAAERRPELVEGHAKIVEKVFDEVAPVDESHCRRIVHVGYRWNDSFCEASDNLTRKRSGCAQNACRSSCRLRAPP